MTDDNIKSSIDDIDWNALDKLKRNDLQRLCKEFDLPVKGNAKNAEILDALVQYKKNYDEKNTTIKKKEIKKQPVQSITDQLDQFKEKEKEKVKDNEIEKEKEKDNVNNKEKEIVEEEEQEIIIKEIEEDEKMMKIDNQDNSTLESIDDNDVLDSLPIPEEDITNEKYIKRSTTAKKRHEDDEENENDLKEVEKVTHVGLKFRNYVPRENTLLPYRIPKSKVPPIVEELLARLKVLESGADDDTLSLLPKKQNWDLKRDVEKKMDKLEKRTNAAIYQLIKQTLSKADNEDTKMNLLTRTVDKSSI